MRNQKTRIFEKENKTALLWMWRVIYGKRYYIGILLAIAVLLGVSGGVFALLLSKLIDCAVEKDGMGVRTASYGLIVLTAIQLTLRAFDRYFNEKARATYENRMKSRLFSELMMRSYEDVTHFHSGEWMNRLTSDTVVAADGLAQVLPGVAGMLIRIVTATGMLLYILPKLAVVLIPGGILIIVFSWSFRKIMKRLHKKVQEADGRLRVFLTERLSGLMMIHAFIKEKETMAEADKRMDEHKGYRMKKSNFSNLCNIGFGAAMNGAYVIGAIYCGYGILKGNVSYGTFTAVLQLVAQIQAPFANISGYVPKYFASLASAERLMQAEEFAFDGNTEPSRTDSCTDSFLGFAIRHGCFCYDGQDAGGMNRGSAEQPQSRMVLDDFNMDIRKGEFVAFTGPSGCGKTTVLKILMSLYTLKSGESVVLTDCGEEKLTARRRRLFAYVPQGNHLMSGTIEEAVTFGEQNINEKKLKEALSVACAEFVWELPEQVNTRIGERGMGMSEGQIQRIAIARALYADRPVLVLDEATSALDAETEKRLLSNLRKRCNKTVLIVTHRPAALAVCDREIHFAGENEL